MADSVSNRVEEELMIAVYFVTEASNGKLFVQIVAQEAFQGTLHAGVSVRGQVSVGRPHEAKEGVGDYWVSYGSGEDTVRTREIVDVEVCVGHPAFLLQTERAKWCDNVQIQDPHRPRVAKGL